MGHTNNTKMLSHFLLLHVSCRLVSADCGSVLSRGVVTVYVFHRRYWYYSVWFCVMLPSPDPFEKISLSNPLSSPFSFLWWVFFKCTAPLLKKIRWDQCFSLFRVAKATCLFLSICLSQQSGRVSLLPLACRIGKSNKLRYFVACSILTEKNLVLWSPCVSNAWSSVSLTFKGLSSWPPQQNLNTFVCFSI